LHIAVDDEESRRVASFRITKGNIHDTKKFGQLMKESARRYSTDKVYGDDKAYDNRRKNFNLLDCINAEPTIISSSKNASSRSKGCQIRRDEVFLLIKKLGYERWKELKYIGRRWMDCRSRLLLAKESIR